MYKKILWTMMMFSIISQAFAVDDQDGKKWKASAELGYVSTSGNTKTETLNTKAIISSDRLNWRHKLEITVLNASDDIGTTAEKFTATGQSDFKLSDRNYLFGNVADEEDKFSGYQYRLSEVVGYGRRVIEKPGLVLGIEIGPGARQSKLDNGGSENEGMVRGAAKLNWAVSETSDFTEDLTVDVGEDVTITKSVSGLSSQINNTLSMKITYTYKLTSDVPVGIDDIDTETAITLVYAF